MDNKMLIRAGIFLIAGLVLLFFPNQVNRFQNFILEKLHFKRRIKNEKKHNIQFAIFCFVIAIVLFAIATF